MVSIGIYVMNPSVLGELAENTFQNLPDYIPQLAKSGAGSAAIFTKDTGSTSVASRDAALGRN